MCGFQGFERETAALSKEVGPHGVRVKGQRYRRVFVSDELDALYGEYAWQLCDANATLSRQALPDSSSGRAPRTGDASKDVRNRRIRPVPSNTPDHKIQVP